MGNKINLIKDWFTFEVSAVDFSLSNKQMKSLLINLIKKEFNEVEFFEEIEIKVEGSGKNRIVYVHNNELKDFVLGKHRVQFAGIDLLQKCVKKSFDGHVIYNGKKTTEENVRSIVASIDIDYFDKNEIKEQIKTFIIDTVSEEAFFGKLTINSIIKLLNLKINISKNGLIVIEYTDEDLPDIDLDSKIKFKIKSFKSKWKIDKKKLPKDNKNNSNK